MTGKPAGSVVRLRVDYWEGDGPEDGDFLRTDAGSCYQIREVRGKTLICLKLDRDAVRLGAPGVWRWRWSAR